MIATPPFSMLFVLKEEEINWKFKKGGWELGGEGGEKKNFYC